MSIKQTFFMLTLYVSAIIGHVMDIKMNKTIQIIQIMKNKECSKKEIYLELAFISENYYSHYSDLTNYDCHVIRKIFSNDPLLDSAFKMSYLK